MLNWKKMILPSVLAASIAIPNLGGVVCAASPNENPSAKRNFNKKIEQRKQGYKNEKENKEALIEKAESILPGVKDKWDNIINENRALKEEIHNLVGDNKLEKSSKLAGKSGQKNTEFKAQMEEIKSKVDNGEITKEEAKEQMKANKEEFKAKMEDLKAEYGQEKLENKEKRNKITEDKKELFKQLKDNWQALKDAVEAKDASKVESSINAILENETKSNEKLKDKIQQIKTNTNEA